MTHMEGTEKGRYGLYVIALLFGWLVLSAFLAGSFPLIGPDEPRYSQVARQMFESGDWITPRLGENPWFEKPVLLYWLMSLCFSIFGVTEFAARLPSILSSAAVTVFIYLMVKIASGSKKAFLSAVVWMTSLFFVGFTHAATFDMLLTACVTGALFFFFRYEVLRRPIHLYCLYFFCGLGILAKGLVSPILVGLPILTYLVLSGRLKELREMKPGMGILIVIATAAIWFLPVSLVHGIRFWDEFVYQHHFVRYTSSHFHTSGGIFYYLPILLLGTYPWTIAPLLGSAPESNREQNLKRFSFCWLFSIVLFFSFSGSKLPGYILPGIPAFFVLSGLSIGDFLKRAGSKIKWIVLILTLNVAVLAGLATQFPDYVREYGSIRMLAGAIAGCTILSSLLCLANKKVASLLVYPLPLFLALYFFVQDFLPKSGWGESKILALALEPALPRDQKLLLYNIYAFDMVFYTHGRVELTPEGYFLKVEDAQQLYNFVRQKKQAFVLVGNEELLWIEKFSLWKVRKIIRGKERSIVQLELKEK